MNILCSSGKLLCGKKITIIEAERLLEEGIAMNPGPWGEHSRSVAFCARRIAERCDNLDQEKAYIYGLLHDIGRRFGVTYLAHVYDGYKFMMESGFDDAARICLTHSFNSMNINEYIGKFDISEAQQNEISELLDKVTTDDYDLLIQLCDCMGTAEGIVPMEERMQDIKNRYGYYPQEKWDRNLELRAYFEEKTGMDIYEICKI
jgi:hypothetical protein